MIQKEVKIIITKSELEKKLNDAERKIEELKKSLAEKDKLLIKLKGHNARGAGRRKADDKWMDSYREFAELYESQKLINEIMEKMGISRSTYYRYKKLHKWYTEIFNCCSKTSDSGNTLHSQ